MTVLADESTLSDDSFERIAQIAITDAGLFIPKSKKALVQSRIAKRLRALGLKSPDAYVSLLDDLDHVAERKELISTLTTNVSSFYRERHHFKHLKDTVFPILKAKIARGEKVRLWSAGCSGGQEPYTLGIEILNAFDKEDAEKVLILATDIDPIVLEKARIGRYASAELEVIRKDDRETYFSKDGDHYQIIDFVKSFIRFRELNIHADWPMKGQFDAIFCRNVLIYFDDAHQAALWPRFHQSLLSKGHLYLGHSERIHQVETSGFSSIGATIYQKTT